MNWEHFWWNDVQGPRSFIHALTEQLIAGKSVQIKPCPWLPWRGYMRELARELAEQSGMMTIHFISESNDFESSEGAGEYLIQRFTPAAGYRPHSEKWWAYIKRIGELEGQLFWIYGASRNQLLSWHEACSRLKGICSFVFELEGEKLPQRGYVTLDAGEYILEYDDLFFASRVVSERKDVKGPWRRYLSELAVQAYAGEAERILHFVENYNLQCPPESCDNRMTHEAIWRAQLRNAYHLIEEERLIFIQKNEDKIEECMPETQYQEEILNPYEAELGFLWHLTDAKREENGKKRMILPRPDYDWLRFLRESRNRLAHHDILSPLEMERLLFRV